MSNCKSMNAQMTFAQHSSVVITAQLADIIQTSKEQKSKFNGL